MLGTVVGVTPALAPIAGGYLHVHFGWQGNFFVIAVAALIAFEAVRRPLPESGTPDPDALDVRRVGHRYRVLLGNADFLMHSLMLGAALGLIMVFVTGASFVLIGGHGVAPNHFGWYQAAIVATFVLGSVFAARVVDRWTPTHLLRFGVSIIVAGSIALLGVVFIGPETPASFTGAYMAMTFGMGPLFAAAPSLALRSIDGQAGTASALLSGINQTSAACAAVAVSLLASGGSRTVAGVGVVLALGLLALHVAASRASILQAKSGEIRSRWLMSPWPR